MGLVQTPDTEVTDPYRLRARDRPRYRGVSHGIAFAMSVPVGMAATASAGSVRAGVATGVFAFTVSLMFGTSALFHLPSYDDDGWFRMRRVDHTAIFLLIAGTITPIAMLAVDGRPRTLLLVGTWLAVSVGIGFRWSLVHMPRGLMTTQFIAIGWIGLFAMPRIWDALGALGGGLLLAGGLCYTIGSFVVGARWPDPWPATFGYHEIWHVLVIVAVSLHYVVIVFFVVH